MNEMDLLTEFRAEVPLRVSPQAEELFHAGIKDHFAERPMVPAPGHPFPRSLFPRSLFARSLFPRSPFPRIGIRWRLGLAAGLAAALAAALAVGLVTAVQPSGQLSGQPSAQLPVLTAKLLADRAAAAALAGPIVPAGQWVYRQSVTYTAASKGKPATSYAQAYWSTADGSLTYLAGGWGWGPGHALYSKLGTLPAEPVALDAYLAKLSYPNANATQASKGVAAFTAIENLLVSDILSPSLNAELYRALGDIPTVQVKSHVTDIQGRPGVAFVLPDTSQSENLEIILDASHYSYLADASWGTSGGSPDSAFSEAAVLHTTLVSGPGSTQAATAPPSQAELTAERAVVTWLTDRNAGSGIADGDPGQWVYRKLGTGGGTQEVWARADDSEQASYVHGRLVTCVRPAGCARDVTWLMTAGPAYPAVYPTKVGRTVSQPTLPPAPQALLDNLNVYRTGCSDTAGDCSAVGVFASMLLGYGNTLLAYGNMGLPTLTWYFSLADVPGVSVRHVTDAAGRADVEFSFPFTSGVTGILFSVRTYHFVGYVENGTQTLLLQQANVARPGLLPLSP